MSEGQHYLEQAKGSDSPDLPPKPNSHTDGEKKPAGPKIQAKPLSDYEIQSVEWLWQDWLARGELTIPHGREGIGKTMIMKLCMAATLGIVPWPGSSEAKCHGNVGFMFGEENISKTLLPGLQYRYGDLLPRDKIFDLGTYTSGKKSSRTIIDVHCNVLVGLLKELQIALLVVDPLVAFISACKTYQEVNAVLGKVHQVASDADCAILGTMHWNKSSATASSQDRTIDSVGFRTVARCCWAFGVHPEASDKSDPRRILAQDKNNYAPIQKSLEFKIEPIADHKEYASLEFVQVSDCVADDLTGEDHKKEQKKITKLALATQKILQLLQAYNGSLPANVAASELKALGISMGTASKARQILNLKAVKTGTSWFYYLDP